jgi:hypothetical protein
LRRSGRPKQKGIFVFEPGIDKVRCLALHRRGLAARCLAFVALSIAAVFWSADTRAMARERAALTDDSYLAGLVGNWDMTGTLGKTPVHYRAVGTFVLENGWLEFRMKDVGNPSQYEAWVFIGHDAKAADYILHWIDQFGAGGARVVGTGERNGTKLTATFPYAEGAFRNTWELHQDRREWTLLIEAQQPDKSWHTFAQYTIK